MEDPKIDSIFKVIHYRYACHDTRKLHYPSFRVNGTEEVYFKTLEEVENYITDQASIYTLWDTYAYVAIEIPLSLEVNISVLDQYLSIRIYRADGTLWGENRYAHFFPKRGLNPDGYNYWGRRNIFMGREPGKIRFKPGDIVEILGYPGNMYWEHDRVELAIITKTPPTKAEVAERMKEYMDTHSGFDICDHSLSVIFDSHMDTYEVISFSYDGIDHAPTISVFPPSKPISAKRRTLLEKMFSAQK